MSPRQHHICACVNMPSTNHAFLSVDMKTNNEHFARQQHAIYFTASIYGLYALHIESHKAY